MTEAQIIDYNLLIKCLTILLIVAAVVLVIFKSKWKGLKLKTKYGDVELEQNGQQQITTEGTKVSKVKQKYGYNEETLERELKRIIGKINTSITKNLLSFIIKNDLHLKSNTEMENYIEEKINWLKNFYNDELSKSMPLEKLNIDTILLDNEPAVKFFIKNEYRAIYNNHIESYEKYQQFLDKYKNKYICKDILDEALKINRDTFILDISIIEDILKYTNTQLIKSFKDNILTIV